MDRHEFSLALARPLGTARGDIERRDGLLIRLGVGIGEATPLPGWTESLPACRRALDAVEDALHRVDPVDRDPTDPLAAAPAVAEGLADTPAARHAVELATLDARGRRTGRSLAALLGDDPAATVPVNATVGDASVEETAAAAREAVDAGFDCLKIKVGAGRLDRDVARLRAVRDAVGEAVELRADANGAWDREQAERALEAVDPLDLEYVEQPMPAAEVAAHAGLRNGGNRVPIALDESLAERPVTDLLAAEAADYLVLKPMALGGPDRARNVARQARQAGVTPVVSTTIDGVVARTAAVHVAAAIPEIPACGLATADWLADDLGPDPAPVADGQIEVPQAKGLGVDLGDE